MDPMLSPIDRIVVTELLDTRRPWLMLADDPDDITGRHAFFSLADNKIYEIVLPEAKWKRCVGSTDGWLITVDTNLDISMLNPFSRIQIPLPRHPTFEDWYLVGKPSQEHVRDRYIHKAFLSSPPTFSSNSCVALAILNEKRSLAFARPGKSTIDWTPIQTYDMIEFQDAVFYKGRFYAVTRCSQLVVCNLSPVPKVEEICRGPKSLLLQCWSKYIVNLHDTLLLVGRHREDDNGYYRTVDFKAYVLVPYGNEGGGEGEEFRPKWKRVTSLRSLAVFIGGNTSTCVYADDIPGCQRNSIYFTDDYVGTKSLYYGGPGSDMGVYNYEDGTIGEIYPGTSRSRLWPPIWVIPNQDLHEQSKIS
ncbi:hypothetical protein Sjap_016387 [Stephania japonica]|uniref:KIB1-4 beta-propeller domain-containing protein n=1 Tax=Stephania japonica TaxID=461633 RepID=A0AAP0ILH2_9MAGN